MIYSIHYASEAVHDLDEIWEYISEDLQNPNAAESTINGITAAVDNLSHFPKMGAALSSIIPLESNYRFIHYGKYIVFYRIQSNNVYIDRILYGKRNYLKILFPDDE